MMNDNRKSFDSWETAVKWLRSQPDKSQLVTDCYYDDPLVDAARRYWQSDEWQAVKELLIKSPGKALDVGAGRGIASYALSLEGFDVIALEPDPSDLVGTGAIRELKREGGVSIKIIKEFSERLPFKDDTFDLVFARAVLHHIDDLARGCREFFRVLRPGGQLVAIREHVISRQEDLHVFHEKHPLHRLYGGEDALPLNGYVSALRQAGFTQLKVISPWHSAINFAPYSLSTLKCELSRRAGLGIPLFIRLWRFFLDLPGTWSMIRWAAEKIDRRPGRLYSFVAKKR